jgi:hypothetical protein
MAAAVWGNAKITLRYLGSPTKFNLNDNLGGEENDAEELKDQFIEMSIDGMDAKNLFLRRLVSPLMIDFI